MALAKTLWSSIIDLVSTGQTVSDKLDTAFANIDTAITQVDTNTTDIATIQTELATNISAVSIVTQVRPEQVLVANTPVRLDWMEQALVDAGGTDISYVLANNQFTIQTSAIYKVFGVVSFVAPINDIVEVELYIDNLPTGFKSSAIGRDSASVLTLSYEFMSSFNALDEIDLYVTSTGTSITVSSASVTVEKTKY